MNSWFTFYSIYSQCIGLPTAVSPPLANETGKQPDHLYPTNNVFLSWKYNKWICSWTNNVFLFYWKCNKWICARPTTYFSPETITNWFVLEIRLVRQLFAIGLDHPEGSTSCEEEWDPICWYQLGAVWEHKGFYRLFMWKSSGNYTDPGSTFWASRSWDEPTSFV